jgi:hypothetical protein
MRRFFTLFFAFIVLAPTLLRFGMVADYLVRYERYSMELCENLDKPELSCDGKCKLGKNMISVEKSELPLKPQLPNQKLVDILGFSHELPDFELTTTQTINSLVDKYSCNLEAGFSGQVFQPPTKTIQGIKV